MTEHVVKIELRDIQISVILFDEAFSMKRVESSASALPRLKAVHEHSNYEIFFVTSDTLTVASTKESISCERSLVIIPPLFEHYTAGSEFEGYTLNFIMEAKQGSDRCAFDKLRTIFASRLTVLPLTEDELFYVKHISDCMLGRLPQSNLKHYIYLLFSELLSRIMPPKSEKHPAPKKQANHINIIETYVTHHYFEDIGLVDVSREVGLCKKQISRIVQKEYGCSFPELVTRHRMSAACMLLRHTTLHIYEIAENVGYCNHENYFCALFKKKYGITPTQYRKQAAEDSVGIED